MAEYNSTINRFKVICQTRNKKTTFVRKGVCVQGPESMCTKQCFGFWKDFNLSDKNLISQYWEAPQEVISPLVLVQPMGAVCTFDQGHVYVDDNEKTAGCPKSVVTLPSKYTCFSFTTSSFSCCFLHRVDWVFYVSRSVSNANKASQNWNSLLNSLRTIWSNTQFQKNKTKTTEQIQYVLFNRSHYNMIWCGFLSLMSFRVFSVSVCGYLFWLNSDQCERQFLILVYITFFLGPCADTSLWPLSQQDGHKEQSVVTGTDPRAATGSRSRPVTPAGSLCHLQYTLGKQHTTADSVWGS